jgi:hypothetical protein
MKEILKGAIIDKIKKWTETDIYAVSLFVYNDGDNPSKPTVTLGYNTESRITQKESGVSDIEFRWNYAYWLQNDELRFGFGDTAEIVKNWIVEQGLEYHENLDYEYTEDAEENDDKITESFIELLIEIVKEIHEDKILTEKFGKELPILIHELEYYDEIAEQNIEANGEELVKEFITFIDWMGNV